MFTSVRPVVRSVAYTCPLLLVTAALATPTFDAVGTLTGAGTSRIRGISNNGSVGVGVATSAGGLHAVRWTPAGGLQDLGTLPGGTTSDGYGISADGLVLTGRSSIAGGQRAFRWTAAGGMTDLGIVAGTSDSYGYKLSADGSACTGYALGTSISSYRGFRWTPAGLVSLGVIAGFQGTTAYSISGDGNAICGQLYAPAGGGSAAYRWTPAGGIVNLGRATAAHDECQGYAISADGNAITGYSGTGSPNLSLFRWTASGGMQDLGILAGNPYTVGYAMNSTGSVIVGTAATTPGSTTGSAILWTPVLGIVNLNTYLPTLGINLTGWSLRSAWAVSPDGTAIAGDGTFNGNTRGWVVRGLALAGPCTADVGTQGGLAGADGTLDNNDFVVFVNFFFAADARADLGRQGGLSGADGLFDNNDFVVFVNAFFAGC